MAKSASNSNIYGPSARFERSGRGSKLYGDAGITPEAEDAIDSGFDGFTADPEPSAESPRTGHQDYQQRIGHWVE